MKVFLIILTLSGFSFCEDFSRLGEPELELNSKKIDISYVVESKVGLKVLREAQVCISCDISEGEDYYIGTSINPRGLIAKPRRRLSDEERKVLSGQIILLKNYSKHVRRRGERLNDLNHGFEFGDGTGAWIRFRFNPIKKVGIFFSSDGVTSDHFNYNEKLGNLLMRLYKKPKITPRVDQDK